MGRGAKVFWFTGLSGAGKTTLAKAWCARLRAKNEFYHLIDGDELRGLFPETGFSPEARREQIRRAAYAASVLQRNGIHVVVALISPFRDGREEARKICSNFLEIFIDTPLEICQKRDPKGLYQRVAEGKIQQFTGIDSPYETPERPDLQIKTQFRTVEDCLQDLEKLIEWEDESSSIRIRFNTQWEAAQDPNLKWRLLINGKEELASEVYVQGSMMTTEDRLSSGILKYHISCRGNLTWEGTKAFIRVHEKPLES